MKRLILILFSLAFLAVTGYAQEPDTVVIAEPGGFEGFYEKYSAVIWTVLTSLGVFTWLTLRYNRLKKAFDLVRVAGDDDSPQGRIITLDEWRGILKGFGAVFGKLTEEEKDEIVSKLKK